MQKAVRVLACCLVLAGCYEAEQEFSGEIEAASLDLTQPVPGGTVYITCGQIEGVELYPLDLDPFFKVRGGYEISTANREIVPQNQTESPQAFLNYNNSRRLPNTNFFITGLKDGCTAVFSAVGLFITTGRKTVSDAAENEYPVYPSGIPNRLGSETDQSDEGSMGFTKSHRVNQEIIRRMHDVDRTLQGLLQGLNLVRNAIVLFFDYNKGTEFDYNGAKTIYVVGASMMILDRVVFAEHVVRVKG